MVAGDFDEFLLTASLLRCIDLPRLPGGLGGVNAAAEV
jgi:hypothetical protein